MSQVIENSIPDIPSPSQEEHPIVPSVIIAVPIQEKKGRGRPKKPVTEEEKAAAEAVKAEKEAEKKAKEEEKAKKEAEKAAEKAKKDAEKAAKEAAKAEKDANKKPRGRPKSQAQPERTNHPDSLDGPKKESPTLVPTHNPDDVAVIAHLKEDVASDASIIVALRAEIAALKEENARFSEIISSVCALVSL